MTKSPKHSTNFWRQLLWKIGLIGVIIILLSQIVVLWLIGAKETVDAFSSGRRFVITLDSGAIDGKIISSIVADEVPPENPDIKINEPTIEPTIEPNQDSSDNSKHETDEAPVNEPTEKLVKDEVIDTTINTPEENEPEEKEEESALSLPAITPSDSPPAKFSTEIAEKTEFGFLPKISDNGTKPWKYYSKPFTITGSKPMISIIVTGLGNNREIAEQALRLPEAINLSFSPYTKNLKSWMVSARLSGHETLLDLPMESSNYPASDPGPLGLLVSKEQQENGTRIKELMANDSSYVGFISPQNEVLLDNSELFKSLLQVLSGRGLMLIIGKEPPKDETKEIIEKGNTASVIIDGLIDEELTTSSIQAQLSLLEQTAKQRGYAVGVAQGYPISLKQLNDWSKKAEENGFNIVPVSAIVSKRF
ncbi:MAG: divergent polysaccharide deacetylase family protein [Rickettsiales bacterium]